jgi:hypothetical protein
LRAASVSNNSVCALRISQRAFLALSLKKFQCFSCNLKAALHFADDIGFTFIRPFIAADGPKPCLQWDASR